MLEYLLLGIGFLLAAAPQVLAQPANDGVRTIKQIPFPDGSGVVAVFTARDLPITEPPLPMVRLQIIVKDRGGHVRARIESEDATRALKTDVLLVRGTPTILLGVARVDGPGNRLCAYQLDAGGNLVLRAEWWGGVFDYELTVAGDLRITILKAVRSFYDADLPRVVVWSPSREYEDTSATALLVRRMVEQASEQIGSLAPCKIGRGLISETIDAIGMLERNCEFVLKAAVILGNPAQSLGLCAQARRQIAACSDPDDKRGYVDSMLHKLDYSVETAQKSAAFSAR